MKKVITCDICGKEITKSETRYRFKENGSLPTYFGVQQYRRKLDIC